MGPKLEVESSYQVTCGPKAGEQKLIIKWPLIMTEELNWTLLSLKHYAHDGGGGGGGGGVRENYRGFSWGQ